jgi:two-component system, chemotaxis family, sensor kinase CheA
MKKFPRWLIPVIILVTVFVIASGALYFLGKRQTDYVQDNGTAVQVAGRARLEWQKVMRYVYELKFGSEDVKASANEKLAASVKIFDQAITAMKDGGEVDLGPAGKMELPPGALKGDAQGDISEAFALWSEVSRPLKQVISARESDPATIDAAFALASKEDPQIARIMSTLIGEVSISSFVAAERIGRLQKIASLLGMMFIGALIWLYSRQFNKVEALKKETDEIMQTVPSGLFLLDRNFKIGSQYSAHLEKILGDKNLGGRSFFDVLGRMTSSDNLDTARDYMGLLFGDQVDENLIGDVNPLDRLDAVLPNESGRPEKRHMGFGFKRVLDGKKLSHLLVTVTDITEQVQLREQVGKLERQLDQADGQTLDMITSAMSVEPTLLAERLARYQQLLDEANGKLKDSGRGGAAYRQLVDELFRPLHTLKGETAALGFKSIVIGAEAAEAELVLLRSRPELNGNDFLGVTMRLDDLYARLGKLSALQKKLADAITARAPTASAVSSAYTTGTRPTVKSALIAPNVNTAPRQAISPPATANSTQTAPISPIPAGLNVPHASTVAVQPASAPRVAHLDLNLIQQACMRTAEKLGKKVHIVARGFDQIAVPEALKQTVTDVLVQLVRNALAHGVEAPGVRQQKGKDPTGQLFLQWQRVDEGFELTFRDDGDGINFESIRERAVQLGRMDAISAAKLDARQLAGLIFEPGFSTAQKSSELAGQGVGLDVVMAAVKRANGKIAVGTQTGIYTQFRVRFPTQS